MKILIADDHAVVRKGLARLLADEFSEVTIGESSDSQETLNEISFQRWDLLVLDLFMPGIGGSAVLDEVRRLYPKMPVLILSTAPEEQMAARMLKAGANGYLNKQCAPEELVAAVRKVLAGGRYVSPVMAERLAEQMDRTKPSSRKELSDREYTVLRLLVAGRSIREIGIELGLSPKTVSTFHVRIWRKLGVHNDIEMLRYVSEQGVADGAL